MIGLGGNVRGAAGARRSPLEVGVQCTAVIHNSWETSSCGSKHLRMEAWARTWCHRRRVRTGMAGGVSQAGCLPCCRRVLPVRDAPTKHGRCQPRRKSRGGIWFGDPVAVRTRKFLVGGWRHSACTFMLSLRFRSAPPPHCIQVGVHNSAVSSQEGAPARAGGVFRHADTWEEAAVPGFHHPSARLRSCATDGAGWSSGAFACLSLTRCRRCRTQPGGWMRLLHLEPTGGAGSCDLSRDAAGGMRVCKRVAPWLGGLMC